MRFWFRRRRSPDDFADEVRAHLDIDADELRDSGLGGAEAKQAARRRFGNPTILTEQVYESSPWRWLDTLWQDVRFGTRLIRRAPVFSITAAIVLSLGIGVNTAFFSIINSLFFKPLPVKASQELFYIYDVNMSGQVSPFMEPQRFEFFRTQGADLADFSGASAGWGYSTFTFDGQTEQFIGQTVLGNFFDLLGVSPIVGHSLSPDDDRPEVSDLSVVISYDLWQRMFKGSPDALGREVRIRDDFFKIVGVMPPAFSGLSEPFHRAQFWTTGAYIARRLPGFKLPTVLQVGRLKPGVTFEQMKAFVASKTPLLRDQVLDRLSPDNRVRYRDWMRNRSFPTYRVVDVPVPSDPAATLIAPNVLIAITSVVGLVLLISTANIAGLMMARGVTRTAEVAVRRALGAGLRRLGRQLLTETVLLASLGGLVGGGVAWAIVRIFDVATPARYAVDVTLDWRVLLFAAAVCIGAGLLLGIGPALQAAKVNVLEALGSGMTGAKHVRLRLRYGIVVPQVALSLVLLLVAGVHLHSLSTIELKDLGYRTDNSVVLTFDRWKPRLSARSPQMTAEQRRQADEKDAEETRTFNRSILERVQRVSGVEAFAITTSLPLNTRPPTSLSPLIEYDAELNGEPSIVSADRVIVSDGYFQAMGMRLLRGRSFDERDRLNSQKVVVISDRISRKLFPFGEPIGRKISLVPTDSRGKLDWLEIIGVVNDVDPVLGSSFDHPVMYESLLQQWQGWAVILVASSASGDPTKLVPDLKKAVVGANAFAEVVRVQTMAQSVDELLYPRRLAAGVLVAAGLIGLVLASIGLYGVVSYSIAQRLREIGIRATLGAEPRDIRRLVLKEGALVALLGLSVGAVLSIVALRVSAGVVPGVPLVDSLSFTFVPCLLLLIVLLACLVPARRAARIDPARVLRGE